MDDNARYRVNSPSVVAESLDGEVLIVNLETGSYYSSDGSGEAAWSLLASGQSLGVALEILARNYDSDPAEVRAELTRIAAEFLAEGLLVPAPSASPAPEKAYANGSQRGPFRAPVLKKYTDMQDLLLLDPVHDVDQAAGWPTPREETPGRTPIR